jgi:hypothetical protein
MKNDKSPVLGKKGQTRQTPFSLNFLTTTARER